MFWCANKVLFLRKVFKVFFTSESVPPNVSDKHQHSISINIRFIRKNISIYHIHIAHQVFSQDSFTLVIEVSVGF